MIFQNTRYRYNPESCGRKNGKFKEKKKKSNYTQKMGHPKHRPLEGKETDFKIGEKLFPL